MLFKVNSKTVNIHPFENEQGYHAKEWHIQVTKSWAKKLISLFNEDVRSVVLANEKNSLGKYYAEATKIKGMDKIVLSINKNYLVIENEDYANFKNAVMQLITDVKK